MPALPQSPIDGAFPREWGGKARTLAQLAQTGLAVPPWFVVPAPPSAQDLRLPPDTARQVAEKARELAGPSGKLAVRSSSLAEDGRHQSHAGQFQSFLRVTPDETVAYVESVFRSGRTRQVQAYLQASAPDASNAAGDTDAPIPSALVQLMIDATAAGVAFSADPVSGRRGRVIVTAVRGTAEHLVSGDVVGETHVLDRTGQIIGAPKDRSGQPAVLSPDQVRAVAELALAAERHLDCPQDIEWAFAGGRLWLLQSRPITTLSNLADPDAAPALWDNSNITESYGGMTTPLTYTFARRAYAAVYRRFCEITGVPAECIRARGPAFEGLIGWLRGHIHYNLLNWYRILALLPGFQLNRQFMEQMMGVKEGLPETVVQELAQSSSAGRFRDGLRLARCGFRLFHLRRRIASASSDFLRTVEAALAPPAIPLERQRPDELVAHYRELEAQLLNRWDAPLLNDFFTMIDHGRLRRALREWAGDEDGSLGAGLLSHTGDLASAEPARQLRRLAEQLQPHPGLITCLRQGALQDIQSALDADPALAAGFGRYLDRFGERCLEELKLETPTLQDDPLPLYRAVGELASRHAPCPGHRNDAGHTPFDRAQAVLRHRLRHHPIQRRQIDRLLKATLQGIQRRERLRFERTHVFGRVRRIFRELGKRFAALDLIENSADIFLLTLEEVMGTVDGTSVSAAFRETVNCRVAEREAWKRKPVPPNRFETHGPIAAGTRTLVDEEPFRHRPAEEAATELTDAWQGVGGGPGRVQGRVRVVLDPRRANIQPGDILVAERTDPGWVLLFPLAAGLIVESGSVLSHSAIVARELGLPCVLGIQDATQILRDGDQIEMDGGSGQVWLRERDAQATCNPDHEWTPLSA